MADEKTTGIETVVPVQPTATYQAPSIVQVPQAPTAQSVYSAQNVTSALTSPTARPDLSDPYGLYDSFMKSGDITAAQKAATETQAQINARQQALRTTTTALGNQNEQAMGGTGASINLIGKQVGRATNLASNELAALGENLQAQNAYLDTLKTEATNRYNIALQERSQIQELISATYGKAGISYTDSYETALQKAKKYEKKEAKKAKKEAEKDAKKAEKKEMKKLLASVGINAEGMSRKQMNALYAKEAKTSYDLDMASKRKSAYGSGKDDDIKTTFNETEQRRLINEALAGNESWEQIYQTFDALGLDTAEDSVMDTYLKQKFGY